MNKVFDVESFCNLLKKGGNSKELYLAMQSFCKRNIYSEFYYNDFLDKSNKSDLILEGLDQSGNYRVRFETAAVAFVANAHAQIDACPYVIFLSLGPLVFFGKDGKKLQTIKKDQCGWNDNFSKAIRHTYPQHKKIASLFDSLMSDECFKLLKRISNYNKHKFLTRISNVDLVLKFEVIDFKDGVVVEIDVVDFFMKIHNEIFPKIFDLYHELAKICIRNMEEGD